MPERPELTGLLSETRWLRALALKLCSDADRADDLVQDTWLAALEHPPQSGGPVRGWLATVLRSKLGDRTRSDSRREARERNVARDEALSSTADVVDRAATHRDVVQAVLDLDEPYRTTILLRYFESLPPRKIAARMQVPVATVDSRLVRGHAKLRASLDRRFGRKTWLLALLPIAREASTLAPAATGVLAMNVFLKVSIPIVLIAAALWWGLAKPEPSSTAQTHALPIADTIAASAPEPARLLDEARVESVRAPLESAPSTTPSEPTATASAVPDRIVKGRVLDSSGRSLSGVALGIEGAPAHSRHETRSGAGGSFEIAAPANASAIVSRDPDWTTVLAGYTKILPTNSTNVVVAPRIEIEGRVVDESGTAIEGAEISLLQPENLGADFGFALDLSARRTWRTRSDRSGAFALADVPAIDRTELRVAAGGFPLHTEPAPQATSRSMVLVLVREQKPQSTIEGRVVDAEGRPVASARVSAGAQVASVDDRGRFVLDVAQIGPKVRVVALARGFLPAAEELDKNDPAGWRDEIVLTLSSPPLSIRGRVCARGTAADCEPVPGARVWIRNPTPFGRLDGDTPTVESLLAREDPPFWVFVETDEHGDFEIGGLLERDYWVAAANPRTLEFGSDNMCRAGSTDVRIDVSNPVFERVRGRVITSDGAPVAGARVHLERMAIEVLVRDGTRDEYIQSEPVITDASGAFEFAHVPRVDTTLIVRSDEILSAAMPITPETNANEVVIRASLRLHVQVELDAPFDRANELRILDESGEPIVIRVIRAESSNTNMFARITDGRSEVLSVSDAARTLVLLRNGDTVARLPLHLLPRTVNVVRY